MDTKGKGASILCDQHAGKKECPEATWPCNLSGACSGDLIHAEVDSTHRECQLVCQDFPGCIYYTYNYDNGVCELFKECRYAVRDINNHLMFANLEKSLYIFQTSGKILGLEDQERKNVPIVSLGGLSVE